MEGNFVLVDSIELLGRTPGIFRAWLAGLSDDWINATEGPETWSPFDIVGHLIHGEKRDWIPCTKHILGGDPEVPFVPFDRFAQVQESKGRTLDSLLDEFETLRRENLKELAASIWVRRSLRCRARIPSSGR
ncbi:DinB family protein [Candidatus Bipolaricaulota bacterium]